jgi:DNA-binding NtrC family response regulator
MFSALKSVLEEQGIRVVLAATCTEAQTLLEQRPQLVFTAAAVPGGTWAEVLLAAQAAGPLPVIVVSRYVDLKLYLNVLEAGGADFIVPPFVGLDVAHVVRSALCDTAIPPPRPAGRLAAALTYKG